MLSGTPGPPGFFGVKPLLLVSAALSLCAVESPAVSLAFGAACGAANDLLGGKIGYYAVILTLVCFAASRLLGTVFRANIFSLMLLSLAAVPLLLCGHFLIFRVTAEPAEAWVLLPKRVFPQAALTYICIPAFYGINYFLNRIFNGKEKD